MKQKQIKGKAIEKFLKKEMDKGTLFVYEKYLTSLPEDYLDTLMFLFNLGYKKIKDHPGVICMDEEQSNKFFNLLSKDRVKLLVMDDDHKFMWELILVKEKINGKPDPVKLFIGGENFRKFCDKKNIFYKSDFINGKLMSGSNLMWLKEDGEDCRKTAQ